MLRFARKIRKSILFAAKALLISVLVLVFFCFWYYYYPDAVFYYWGNWMVLFVYTMLFIVCGQLYHAFLIGVLRLGEIIYSLILSVVLTNIVTYFQLSLIARKLLSPGPVLAATLLQIAAAGMGAWLLNKLYFWLYPARQVVVVCSDLEGASGSVIAKLRRRRERYKVCDVVAESVGFEEIVRHIGGYNSVMLCDIDVGLRQQIIDYCFRCGKRVYIVLSIQDVLINNAHSTQLFDTPVLYFKNAGLSLEQQFFKRAFDLLSSAAVLVLASPFMLLIALAIKLCDGGPVLFKQKRLTVGNREFQVYKFRSMVVDAEKTGEAVLASRHDPRVTPVGRVLRMLRLDELPQLFNIFLGDMSVVGPRPERPELAESYNVSGFAMRTRVKAGLTGYAQVYGKYNTSPQDKLIMDLIYIEKYSFLLDLKLIFLTLKILFMPESTEGIEVQQIPPSGEETPDRQ